MYGKILERLGNNNESITQDLTLTIKLFANNLFVEHLPLLLNEKIIPTLAQLKTEGYKLNISSNTGFIEGECLVKVLKTMNLLNYFEFCVFSDQIQASKPSNTFYQKVFDKTNVQKQEILHIGDNYLSDFCGATNFGFHALLIDNKDYSIREIKNFIHERT
jgi:putative hydrolase of the HAD superfamily